MSSIIFSISSLYIFIILGYLAKLSFKEKTQLTMHKSMCNACRRYSEHSIFIDEALKRHSFENLNINIEELKLSIKKKISEQ